MELTEFEQKIFNNAITTSDIKSSKYNPPKWKIFINAILVGILAGLLHYWGVINGAVNIGALHMPVGAFFAIAILALEKYRTDFKYATYSIIKKLASEKNISPK
jgi:hypothetical protein